MKKIIDSSVSPCDSFRLIAPADEFRLALTLGTDWPKAVSGQPAAYFWKDLIAVGDYLHPAGSVALSVNQERLVRWARTGKKMLAAGVAIAINCDHSVSARDCVGYIKDFRVEHNRLLALCQFIGDDAPLLAARNQVSAAIAAYFTDGRGRKWEDAIVHVALTPAPVVPGQEPFVEAEPADEAAGVLLSLTVESSGEISVDPIEQAGADESPALVFACDEDCLHRLRELIPGFGNVPANQAIGRIVDRLEESGRLATASHRVIEHADPAPADPRVELAVRESLRTKLSAAFSRGAIDRHTREKLDELFSQPSAIGTSPLVLLSIGARDDRPLALALAEILIENRPLPTGESTGLQALSRAIPGEDAMLGRINSHMTEIANRR